MTDKTDAAIAEAQRLSEAADLTFTLDSGRQCRIIFPADLTFAEAMQMVATVSMAIRQAHTRNEEVRNPATKLVFARTLT